MKLRFDPWLAGALLVVAVALGRLVAGPLTGDDDYVLHNLASPGWRDVLFAYNVDLVRGEGGETTWYEGFDTLQRRYVRVVPSAFMAVEYRLFGSNPLPLKTVSLLVHLLNLVLAYCLLRHHRTDPVTAAAVVALVGMHPAAAECVLWFACQPILLAALGSLLAAGARPSWPRERPRSSATRQRSAFRCFWSGSTASGPGTAGGGARATAGRAQVCWPSIRPMAPWRSGIASARR